MDEPMFSTLLDSYNQNNRFKLFPYFTVCFSILPSALKVILPVEGSTETIESILRHIDLDKYSFKPVFKYWLTDDSKDAAQSNDYANEYLFKSESGQMLIHFQSQFKAIQVNFLYNIDLPDSEKWILETNHILRSKFGNEKLPKFKVLVAADGGFYTEDVNTLDFKSVDINELYNDDFVEIDALISRSMERKEAGIILLHGDPGTGKTSYIKSLICRFKDKDFIFIQNDFVKELLKYKKEILFYKIIFTWEWTKFRNKLLQLKPVLAGFYIKLICFFTVNHLEIKRGFGIYPKFTVLFSGRNDERNFLFSKGEIFHTVFITPIDSPDDFVL